MEKIPAYLNEKDVVTDWIENVFDDYNCVQSGRKNSYYLGFVNEHGVMAHVYENVVNWNISCLGNLDSETLQILLARLKDMDDDSQDIYCEYKVDCENGSIYQSFYFKEEE